MVHLSISTRNFPRTTWRYIHSNSHSLKHFVKNTFFRWNNPVTDQTRRDVRTCAYHSRGNAENISLRPPIELRELLLERCDEALMSLLHRLWDQTYTTKRIKWRGAASRDNNSNVGRTTELLVYSKEVPNYYWKKHRNHFRATTEQIVVFPSWDDNALMVPISHHHASVRSNRHNKH